MNARVLITPELLAQILRFPDGTRIVSAAMAKDERRISYLELMIQHPAFSDAADIYTCVPVYEKSATETEPKVNFIDWGVTW